MHKCLACGITTITYRFAICAECEKIYGNRSIHWPKWLRDYWNAEQRHRRRDKRIRENEVTFSDLFSEDDNGSE